MKASRSFVIATAFLLLVSGGFCWNRSRQHAQRSACINAMRQIDQAKNSAALERRIPQNGQVPTNFFATYIKGGLASVRCPSGGEYSYGLAANKLGPITVQQATACSVHGNLAVLDAQTFASPRPWMVLGIACLVVAVALLALHLLIRPSAAQEPQEPKQEA